MPVSKKQMALLRAVQQEQEARVEALLEDDGVDPNFSNAGTTPLHEAIKKENSLIMLLLLRNGAYVNAQANGKTPLDAALDKSVGNILFILRMHGGKPPKKLQSQKRRRASVFITSPSKDKRKRNPSGKKRPQNPLIPELKRAPWAWDRKR